MAMAKLIVKIHVHHKGSRQNDPSADWHPKSHRMTNGAFSMTLGRHWRNLTAVIIIADSQDQTSEPTS
jgi:hypothetical protein